jgi:phosphoglycolate phosphatase
MKKLCLFDFDGVLADSIWAYEKHLGEGLRLIGHDIMNGRADLLEMFRGNLFEYYDKKGVPPDDLAKCFKYLSDQKDFDEIALFSGIADVVRKIKKRADIAIVSSNHEDHIKKVLGFNGCEGLFEDVFGFVAGKSKVIKIKKAMRKFHARPSDTYYVVDTQGDIREGYEAGVKVIAVGWGWHPKEELMEMKPDRFADKCEDLLEIV